MDPVRVAIPGDPAAGEVLVQIPSIATLYAKQWLPTPLLTAAAAFVDCDDAVQWVIDTPDEDEGAQQFDFLDEWVCACAVAPRITRRPTDGLGNAVHVGHLSQALKRAIYDATYRPFLEACIAASDELLLLVSDGPHAAALDRVAARYGLRPSRVLGLSDPYTSLDFDMGVALRATVFEAEQIKQRRRNS